MEIEALRKEIDSIDETILDLLSERKAAIKKIAAIKKKLNKPIVDNGREKQIVERLKKIAGEKGLDKNFIASLYKSIIRNSRKEQKENK